jgi:AP-3 complex subunit delta-1
MFEKTLSDLVKGVRANKRSESEYISKCIQEIKEELASKDPNLLVEGILKLLYLHMLGYSMQWAAFNVIELMASPRFRGRRIGYLAASLSFGPTTDVAILTANAFKKDFVSKIMFDSGIALNCLANMVTPDVAVSIVSDVVGILKSNHAYLRKKALLALYKLFLQYPEALRPSFSAIQECLDDSDVGVACCAVNVICELAATNPSAYLGLAPVFFKLLRHTSNNWMMIKLVKLLGQLCPFEPRLAKKLVGSINDIMRTTTAKSLLFECIQTVSVGMLSQQESVELAMSKLKGFIEDPDQNLKFLGLVAMGNFIRVHPALVSNHKKTIIDCLDDQDITIRRRALQLVGSMINEENLEEIVNPLLTSLKAQTSSFRDDLIEQIVHVCTDDNYLNVVDFEWLVSVINQLAHTIPGVSSALRVAEAVVDIAMRVLDVRHLVFCNSTDFISDPLYFGAAMRDQSASHIYNSCCWVVAEYARGLPASCFVGIISLLLPRDLHLMPEFIQCTSVMGATKVLSACAAHSTGDVVSQPVTAEGVSVLAAHHSRFISNEPALVACCREIQARVLPLCASPSAEVQERVAFLQYCVHTLGVADISVLRAFGQLCAGELEPVSSKLQRRLASKPPAGLDLDASFGEIVPPSDDEDAAEAAESSSVHRVDLFSVAKTEKELRKERKLAEKMKKNREEDPFYLGNTGKAKDLDVDSIPIFKLTVDSSSQDEIIGIPPSAPAAAAAKKPKKVVAVRPLMDDGEGDLPDVDAGTSVPSGLLVSDITAALADTEVLPEIKPYLRETAQSIMPQKSQATSQLKDSGAHKKKKKEKSEKHSKDTAAVSGDLLNLMDDLPSSSLPARVEDHAVPLPKATGQAASDFPMQKAGDDGNVELQYHIRALGNSIVRMELTFVNQTTKSISVTGVDVVESLSLLKDDLSVGAEGLVSGQDSCRGHVDLKLTSCKASLKVKLVVQYTLESRALSLPLAIPMPCSSMLTPYKLETDHLASVIASGKCSNLSSSVVRWVALAFLLRVYSCSHFVYLPPFIRNASPAAIQKVFHLLLAASARPSALLKLKTSPTPSLLLQLVSAMMWY